MNVTETFYRPVEVGREARCLPADVYNSAHLLLARARQGAVFVPIRSMQYLAVIDAQECIFVEREGRRMIEIAWCAFRPQARSALTDPVPYEAVYYSPTAQPVMQRLQSELPKALAALQRRSVAPVTAPRVIKLESTKT
ncbi:MAG: hypothetical protein JSW09_09100 [Pseudomonadota bacterium]|nr:MAG: hypothetical protein JSW09_09100 [Pseudomonadota bacterium]